MTLTEIDEIDQLRAERDYWKAEAQFNVAADRAVRIGAAFNLTPAEAWIVATLHAARGAVVRRERLAEDIPGCNWEERSESSNVVEVFISKARRKMGREAIETAKAHGYRLPPETVARIDAVLA